MLIPAEIKPALVLAVWGAIPLALWLDLKKEEKERKKLTKYIPNISIAEAFKIADSIKPKRPAWKDFLEGCIWESIFFTLGFMVGVL